MNNTREVLSELIAQRKKIDAAIEALRALNGDEPKVQPARRGILRGSALTRKRGETPAAVVRFLTENPSTHSVSDIRDGITQYGINGPAGKRYMRVYAALRALEHQGKVSKTNGEWAIAS